MLYDISKENTALSSKSLGFPTLQIFVEMFYTILQSPLRSRVAILVKFLLHQHDDRKILY